MRIDLRLAAFFFFVGLIIGALASARRSRSFAQLAQ